MKKLYYLLVLSLFWSAMAYAEAYIDTPQYQYDVAEGITIQLEELSPDEGYWLGVYPRSSGDNWRNVVSWPLQALENGAVEMESIAQPGHYEARLFYDDSYDLIDTVEFDVGSPDNDCGSPWYTASLTSYESYPTSEQECYDYNGCEWQGQFYGLDGVKSEQWVSEHNIVAVHLKDWDWLGNHQLRIRQGGHEILAMAYDACSDDDTASGSACTDNLGDNDFLIDMEKYTMNRFGSDSGNVEFQVCDGSE